MFTLSVGVTGGDRQLETEVDRLIAVFDLAREEAAIQGREIGVRFYRNSYDFSAYYEDFVDYHDEDNPDQSEWALLDRETLLGPRQLPDGMVFEIQIDGREIVLKDPEEVPPVDVSENENESDDDEAPEQTYEPQVMIFSSGDMSPFTILVRRTFANEGTTIEFDIDGTTEIDEGRE